MRSHLLDAAEDALRRARVSTDEREHDAYAFIAGACLDTWREKRRASVATLALAAAMVAAGVNDGETAVEGGRR